MAIHNLDKIFDPASVAIVGVSDQKDSIGWNLLNNLLTGGFQGSLFPITSSCTKIGELQAYESLSAIGQPIDMVIIAAPVEIAVSAVEDCVQTGCGGILLISVHSEDGSEKEIELEHAIIEKASTAGIRVIGPNSLGAMRPGVKLNASLVRRLPLLGKLAFVSQSRTLCAAILDFAAQEKIGFSHVLSIGCRLDVDFADMIDYLGNDPEVSSILLCIKHLRNFRKFMSAARGVSRIKPIVALRLGSCTTGMQTVGLGIGMRAWENAVYDTAFKRAGIVQVNTIEELFDCAEIAARQPYPTGPGLAIISNGAGPSIMARSILTCYGLDPAVFDAQTITRLKEILPFNQSYDNPLDIQEDASPQTYRLVVESCLDAPQVNSFLIILTPHATTDAAAVAAELAGLLSGKSISIFTVWMGGKEVQQAREILSSAGLPNYDTPERAIAAFMHLYFYKRNLELLQETPPRLPRTLEFNREAAHSIIAHALQTGSHELTGTEARGLINSYGIVSQTFDTVSHEEIVRAAREIGYPVTLKPILPETGPETGRTGLQLNVYQERDLSAAYEGMLTYARLQFPETKSFGVTVQKMLGEKGREFLIGMKQDKDFGPVIFFGMGGMAAEIADDCALALPPLNRLLARRLMEDTRIFQRVRNFRSWPIADFSTLEEVLMRLSQLVIDFPEIVELVINPLVITSKSFSAVNVYAVIKATAVASAMHLVISPYPNQYETSWTMADGTGIFIRPIKPEDEPLLNEFVESLSPRSIYFRFFSPLKKLPHKVLARFTQLDYDRDMALVALETGVKDEKILGVGRIMHLADEVSSEFAIVIHDAWQGKGLGSKLLELCIAVARKQGIKTILATTMSENKALLALARKYGFIIDRVCSSGECNMILKLNHVPD
jgi:acetyltransferase